MAVLQVLVFSHPEMRALFITISVCLLSLAASKVNAQSQKQQLYQESLMERYERMHRYDEFLIAEIRKFPDVKAKEEAILKNSNGQRFALFLVSSNGYGTYNVKMQETMGRGEITHMVFSVDSASGKIREEKVSWKN